MLAYLDLMRKILERGAPKEDRTGTGTLSLFGPQLSFNLADGFPLVTTKKLFTRGMIEELLWFLRGETSVRPLQERGVHIWDEWADKHGELGPIYGYQWRDWPVFDIVPGFSLYDECVPPQYRRRSGIDQIAWVVNEIRTNPNSRRLIVSAWNVADVPRMALPPCHMLFQFYVVGGKLSCKMSQRSADYFLGVPFNIASYALLTMMVAKVADLQPGMLIVSFGDVHLYRNHVEQARLQLSRVPRPLPRMVVPEIYDLDLSTVRSLRVEDFRLTGYDPHPAIAAPVAV